MNYQQKAGLGPALSAQWYCQGPGQPVRRVHLVAGHMDSWPVGASDNAAGNATAMELARVLNANRGQAQPGCPLPLLAGARGRPDGGSTWYCDNLWDDLNKHCVMYVNIDAIGLGDGATVLHSEPAFELWNWIHEMNEFAMPGWEKDYCFPSRTRTCLSWGIGVPSCYNWIYHTPELRTAWGQRNLGPALSQRR